MFKLAIRL